MLLYDLLASLLAAALSGLGVGSGGLLVIYLSLFTDLPQRTAQGINLLFFLFSGGIALAYHGGKRHFYPGALLVMGICGILGSFIGVSLSAVVPADWLRKIFGGMLVFTGILALKKPLSSEKPTPHE